MCRISVFMKLCSSQEPRFLVGILINLLLPGFECLGGKARVGDTMFLGLKTVNIWSSSGTYPALLGTVNGEPLNPQLSARILSLHPAGVSLHWALTRREHVCSGARDCGLVATGSPMVSYCQTLGSVCTEGKWRGQQSSKDTLGHSWAGGVLGDEHQSL